MCGSFSRKLTITSTKSCILFEHHSTSLTHIPYPTHMPGETSVVFDNTLSSGFSHIAGILRLRYVRGSNQLGGDRSMDGRCADGQDVRHPPGQDGTTAPLIG